MLYLVIHILKVETLPLSRCMISAGVRVCSEKDNSDQTKMWYHRIKLLTVDLSYIIECRLLSWGLSDYCNQYLEMFSDVV